MTITTTEKDLTKRLAAELFAKLWQPSNQIDPQVIAKKCLDAAEAFARVANTRKES
jgi:hypothetical protein